MTGEAGVPTDERSNLTRLVAVAALFVAAALVALLLLGGGGGYTVHARFLNASQLVEGNAVDIGGADAGSVEGIEITPDGKAEIELEIDEDHAPLREGTRAVIRAGGLTSTASRYVQLMLPSEDKAGDELPDGAVLDVNRTTTAVDLDAFFNIFDARTRRALRGFYQGGARQFAGRGRQANRGLLYLNPTLLASTRLFTELRHDEPALERFLVESERFVTALAGRRDDLAALIANLNSTTRALGSEQAALAEAIGRFPPFLRQANTTYVNLRHTLDELDPLVEASKPVAAKLRPYLRALRPFARDAVPTIRDARAVLAGPGPATAELNRTFPPLEEIALLTRTRNGAPRRGAFPELAEALRESAPLTAHFRPYTVDLLGWFDDFSHTGAYDALGSFSRVHSYFSGPTPSPDTWRSVARVRQVKRCPGASEEPADDRSNVWSAEAQAELDCREGDRATGVP